MALHGRGLSSVVVIGSASTVCVTDFIPLGSPSFLEEQSLFILLTEPW